MKKIIFAFIIFFTTNYVQAQTKTKPFNAAERNKAFSNLIKNLWAVEGENTIYKFYPNGRLVIINKVYSYKTDGTQNTVYIFKNKKKVETWKVTQDVDNLSKIMVVRIKTGAAADEIVLTAQQ